MLGAGGGVGLAAVQLGRGPGRHGDRGRVVGGEARPWPTPWARRHLVDHRAGDLRARRFASALPGGADVVVDPVGGDLAEPALRALRCGGPLRDRGLRLGRHPPHPAQPGAAQGHPGPRDPVPDFATHLPRRDSPQRGGAVGAARHGPRARPHIGATFALDAGRRPRCATWPTAGPSARSCSTSPRRGPSGRTGPGRTAVDVGVEGRAHRLGARVVPALWFDQIYNVRVDPAPSEDLTCA